MHLLVFAAAILLSACGLVINGTTQNIAINSSPAGATVKVNQMKVGQTPMNYTFNKDQINLVTIEKDGYSPAFVTVNRKISPWIVANVCIPPWILGGLIGAGADLITGGAYNLSPDVIQVELDAMEKASRLDVPQEPVN